MKKSLFVLAIFYTGLLFAQERVLFSIDDEKYSAEEFEAVYLKNRDIGKNIDPKTPSEYLDLYINFKLKVKEARDLGMDTLPRFVREFKNYRNQLAKPYLEDRTVDSLLIAEAYSRMQQEVHASHIMIDLAPGALPEDTIAAYKKIMKIRKQIVDGEITFAASARINSTDVGSGENGGDLGYFSVFDMVYPFETAAYTTPVGEISMPVRSQFGYHLVKVLDKRPNSGTVQVKHIFLISNEKTGAEQAKTAENRIQEIYERLQAGEDFDQLARQFSDDKNTADKGGLLKPFGINAMMREFEENSFALQNTGDYSKPFKTSIGWHIVMLVEKQGLPPFEDVKGSIEQQISRDSRSAKSRIVFINNLKKEYNFTENAKALTQVENVVDESLFKGEWDVAKAAKLKKTLFTLDGNTYSQQDFVTYIDNAQKRGIKGTNPKEEVFKIYSRYINQRIMEYEDSKLEEKYPAFKMLVGEYRDGILLFDLTQEKVWNAASKDSAGLYAFWESNKTDYMWPDRVQANIFSCESEKIAKKVAKYLKGGSSVSEIEKSLNKDSELVVVADSGKYAKGDKLAIDQANWVKGDINTSTVDGRVVVTQIVNVLPSAPKELSEARGLVISDYQKKLEAEWIAALKEKYSVAINEEVFRSVEAELE